MFVKINMFEVQKVTNKVLKNKNKELKTFSNFKTIYRNEKV